MKKIYVLILAALIFPSVAFAQGVVKGQIIFEGAAPASEKVEVKSDTPTCGTEKEVKKISLGKDQGIAEAIVTLVGAEGTLTPKNGALDQVKCEFQPHVQAMPLGSSLMITSSDSVLHNSHGFFEDGSTAFNLAVPIVGMEAEYKTKKAGLIKLRCDAGHTWMSAYVMVTDKPFYAVTDADGGFSLQGMPPGKYELQVWQEWLGTHKEAIEVKEGEQSVTVKLKKE